MERRVGVLVAVVAVLLAIAATGVAVTVVNDDDRWVGHRDSMMSSLGMPGPAHAAPVASESAYLAEMIAHHEEAVAAAEQLRRSERVEMRGFGEAVITSQSAQIDQMQRWLADWYPNDSPRVDYQPMMRDLTLLSGDRLDRVFLEDMIGHHMGAVMMSQQLLMRGVAEHEEVQALAATIRDEQLVEIFQMRQWLRTWFGVVWRHGMPGGWSVS